MTYVTYSPRGFANELYVRDFATRAEAAAFRSEIDNDVNSYTVPASSPVHKATVRAFKRDLELYGRF